MEKMNEGKDGGYEKGKVRKRDGREYRGEGEGERKGERWDERRGRRE